MFFEIFSHIFKPSRVPFFVDDFYHLFQSDNEAAQKVLNLQHSVVKLRPFTEASQQSQEKAKMLGLYGVDVYKKRPKTSMVAANRMLNRALGIRGIDRESKTRSSPNQPSKNLQEPRQTAVTNTQHSNVPSRKDFLQNQKMGSQQSSIAANRMFNRALGIKSDTRLKPKPPRTFSQQQQQCTITRNNIICDNDDANFKLMSERIKSNQIQRLAREEREKLQEQGITLSTQIEAQNQVVRKLEEKERLLQSNLVAMDKVRLITI